MQDIIQAPYRSQPIRRTLRVLSGLLMWFDSRLGTKRIKPFAISLFAALTVITGSLYAASPWYEFVVNKSDSLPGWLFLLDKTAQPGCGGHDVTVLQLPSDARFYRGARMIKVIKGCQGDIISAQHQEVFINGRSVGTYRKFSSQGNHPLFQVPVGEIPAGKVYLYASHPRSYDSRYRSFGLRDISELFGKATRVF